MIGKEESDVAEAITDCRLADIVFMYIICPILYSFSSSYSIFSEPEMRYIEHYLEEQHSSNWLDLLSYGETEQ